MEKRNKGHKMRYKHIERRKEEFSTADDDEKK